MPRPPLILLLLPLRQLLSAAHWHRRLRRPRRRATTPGTARRATPLPRCEHPIRLPTPVRRRTTTPRRHRINPRHPDPGSPPSTRYRS